jgi:CheY-like chemotaxis protein
MAKRILIVEDDEYIRDSLAELLESEGFLITAARNGQEALEVLSGVPLPDLILLDLMMPILNGFQFREEMQNNQSLAHIPVIVMSADGHVQEKLNKTHANGYLKKPLDIDLLLETLKSFL